MIPGEIHNSPLAWHEVLPVSVENAGKVLEYNALLDDGRKYLYHKKWWHNDMKYCNPVPQGNVLPPFQLWRERSRSPITHFRVVWLETGQTFNLFEQPQTGTNYMTAGGNLQVLPEGQYNYPLVGCVPQITDDAEIYTSYGFSIGQFVNFRYLQFWIYPYDALNIPTAIKAYLYDGKGGNLLDEKLFKFLDEDETTPQDDLLFPGEARMITWELTNLIQNADQDVLWLELSGDAKFSLIGRDGYSYDFTPEINTVGTDGDVLIAPSIDQPGANFDGFVNAYLSGTPGDVIIYDGSPIVGIDTIPMIPGTYYAVMLTGDLVLQAPTVYPITGWTPLGNDLVQFGFGSSIAGVFTVGEAVFLNDGLYMGYVYSIDDDTHITVQGMPQNPDPTYSGGMYQLADEYVGVDWYDYTQGWISEIFNVVPNIDEFLKLEWWNYRPFKTENGYILYDNDYRNVLYLASYLVNPDYEKEVTIKNRNGERFKTSIISRKSWNVITLLPEYIIDAIRLAEEHDRVLLTDQYGREYDVTYFEVSDEVEWQQGSRLAKVTLTFEIGSRTNPSRSVSADQIEGFVTPGDSGDVYGDVTTINLNRVAQTYMFIHPGDGSQITTISLPFDPPPTSEEWVSFVERFEVYRGSDRIIFYEDGSDGHTWDSTLQEFYLPSNNPLVDEETLFFRLLPK